MASGDRREPPSWILARGVASALCIASCALPILALQRVFAVISGKNTDFNFSVGLTVTATLALSASITAITRITDRRKMKQQSDELIRLRERVDLLERERNELRDRIAETQRKSVPARTKE